MFYAAVDAANPPAPFIQAIEGLGFTQMHAKSYMHGDGIKILDLHFSKAGTDLFEGWTDAERVANLQAIGDVLKEFSISVEPRVMSLAEAFR